VDREGADRIVYLELVEAEDREYDEYARNGADDHGRADAHERAGSGDGDEPARQPFMIMERSGFLRMSQAVAAGGERRHGGGHVGGHGDMGDGFGLTAMVEAGLKPNHPNQSTSAPSVAVLMLWP
jgi:hypothetical protein